MVSKLSHKTPSRPRTKRITENDQIVSQTSRRRRSKTPHRSLNERIEYLFDDPLVHKESLGSYRVYCLPCGQRLQLERRCDRPFYAFNWTKHRNFKCQPAIEAQRRIKNGKDFEVANIWKTWSRELLTEDDKASDRQDQIQGRGLYDPYWRKKYVEFGLSEGSTHDCDSDDGHTSESESHGMQLDDPASELVHDERQLAFFLATMGLHLLAGVALNEANVRQL
ncbi:hypothetical protein L218DRAFT_1006369 [Marasmius fiardii PR-910]|nr:hypothetical protein L218DRAFT_1006369 [Marasmius fiardii PR-910]